MSMLTNLKERDWLNSTRSRESAIWTHLGADHWDQYQISDRTFQFRRINVLRCDKCHDLIELSFMVPVNQQHLYRPAQLQHSA